MSDKPWTHFPSRWLWMIVNKLGIHCRWMSTVISPPPIQHVDFPFLQPDLSYCDNPGQSGGQGFCFGCRRQSFGGARSWRGVSRQLLAFSPGIHIYKLCRFPREHLLLVTCHGSQSDWVSRCAAAQPLISKPSEETLFLSVFHWEVGVFCAFGLEMLINGTPRAHYADVLSFMARPARGPSESSKLNVL